jgi:integrase
MKLTNETVAKITPPANKFEVRVFDDDLPGFGVRVRDPKKPKRTWIIQYRINGRSTTHTVGRFEKMAAGIARDLAKKRLAKAELGIDPAKEKQTARQHAAETFETVATRFLKHKENNVKPRSFEQIETHLKKHWSSFNSRSVHDIGRRDIALLLNEIAADRGPYAANRARATLSNFYTWAMQEGIVEANPVIGTNRQTDEKARERVLSDVELAAIWNACNADDYGDIVRLLILTAQRRDEVGAIQRGELDLTRTGRKWTIPSSRTKNGRPHEVPLSDPAVAILKAAVTRPGREEREAIFGDGASGRGFGGWSKAKAALDKRIKEAAAKAKPPRAAKSNGKEKEQEGWRVHDIRRTVATRMADLGVLPHVIEAVLNHVSGYKAGVAGVYNRALYSAEKRQALDVWAAHVEALAAGKAGSNVTAMKGLAL